LHRYAGLILLAADGLDPENVRDAGIGVLGIETLFAQSMLDWIQQMGKCV